MEPDQKKLSKKTKYSVFYSAFCVKSTKGEKHQVLRTFLFTAFRVFIFMHRHTPH